MAGQGAQGHKQRRQKTWQVGLCSLLHPGEGCQPLGLTRDSLQVLDINGMLRYSQPGPICATPSQTMGSVNFGPHK